ncbi:MAG: hypothetical protein ACLUQK_05910 [Clostridium sp.]|uniref:hypothetical protein n=1 Tax=Clostridium innocuum TaxID=1522 RepID=UPI001AF78DEF|nr:hypothetical protein [[Clostridium] innocuum]QSI27333.1 hypothetical protein GKZ87_18460 [Erysipelotrichaceae bacterium 66202529]MCC2831102.1 hypothetical protein [[Clostridium] innocuum]MCR0246720.1 hypothetical protein [[Clostridium] innocuum]MCR0259793.1 hypothetical protein [[Clostridium] innocuum]MCR0391274.1 hypothetical protein [[Clostridium] innocuum]
MNLKSLYNIIIEEAQLWQGQLFCIYYHHHIEAAILRFFLLYSLLLYCNSLAIQIQ